MPRKGCDRTRMLHRISRDIRFDLGRIRHDPDDCPFHLTTTLQHLICLCVLQFEPIIDTKKAYLSTSSVFAPAGPVPNSRRKQQSMPPIMEDFQSETDSDYTSYWRDWVSLFSL